MNDPGPDFTTYTLAQLYDCRAWVDRDRYPERLRAIEAQIERRLAEAAAPTAPPVRPVERNPVEPQFCNGGRRLAGGGIDVLVLAVPLLLEWQWYGDPPGLPATPLLFLLSSLFMLGYSVLLHRRFGRTIGKMIVGVEVTDLSMRRLSWSQALARDLVPAGFLLARLFAFLPALLAGAGPRPPGIVSPVAWGLVIGFGFAPVIWHLVEWVSLPIDPARRSLPDRLGETVVVRRAWLADWRRRHPF